MDPNNIDYCLQDLLKKMPLNSVNIVNWLKSAPSKALNEMVYRVHKKYF
jgi:hypothetical protein